MSDAQQSFLDDFAGQGYDDFTANSYNIPFLKISQKLSPECNKKNERYIEGLEEGKFFNSLTGKIYGDTITLIPIKQKELWLEYVPNRGGFRGSHVPGSIKTVGDLYDKEGLKTLEGNDIADTIVFYCLIADEPESGPIVFSLYGSGIRHAKTWNSLIMTTKTSTGKQAPYFGSVWELSLSYNENDSGQWYQIGAAKGATNVKRIASITKDVLDKYILPIREVLKIFDTKVDFEQLDSSKSEQKALADNTKSDY